MADSTISPGIVAALENAEEDRAEMRHAAMKKRRQSWSELATFLTAHKVKYSHKMTLEQMQKLAAPLAKKKLPAAPKKKAGKKVAAPVEETEATKIQAELDDELGDGTAPTEDTAGAGTDDTPENGADDTKDKEPVEDVDALRSKMQELKIRGWNLITDPATMKEKIAAAEAKA